MSHISWLRARRRPLSSPLRRHEALIVELPGAMRTPVTQALLAWVRRYKPECIFLMETKTNLEGIMGISRMLGYQYSSIIPSEGIQGGFCLLWNSEVEIKVIEAKEGVFEVVVTEPITNLIWNLFAVYGRPYENEKREFWEMMEAKVSTCSNPWLIVGDLNLIAYPWDKNGEEENTLLEKIPSHEEIWSVVAAMHPLKAPGPDGMPGYFFRRYWEIVGNEVIHMVQKFFISGRMEGQLNHTFICLIPKEENACSVDKFRPISLCNFAYKILSKIIATRLREVINKLICPFQSAFLPGRRIAESSILTQELVYTIKKKKGKGGLVALKLDMPKAYDRLEWNFLREVLRGNGFDDQVTNIILECVRSISFSVLINGVPQKKFYPERGLRQGDPLSPFLFLLCHDVLSKLILKKQVPGQLHGISISRSAPESTDTKGSDSAFWKGVLRSREILCTNVMTMVGRGDSIDIWRQPWIPWLEYHEFIATMDQVRRKFPQLRTVVDISNSDGSWNSDIISQIFGESMGDRICGIPRLPQSDTDVLVWKGATDGVYTVRKGYEATQLPRSVEDSNLWKNIWKQGLQFRLSFMIWRASMGCLPTRDRLGFVEDKLCPVCEANLETTVHIFWECHCARALWFSGPLVAMGFAGCLFDGVWKARNELLYKSKVINIDEVWNSILRKYSEGVAVQEEDLKGCKNIVPSRAGGKISDSTEVLCVSDAFWKNGVAGLAVGLVHLRENRVLWFARKESAESPAEAKMLAIRWGLQLATRRGFKSIAVAFDAMVLIKAFHEQKYS
uniref:Reverse transcriptase domain-containing protein n=1 Tax=Cannabis sativa TaxID=3483 RepID=A0A803QD31_CANSA